MRPLALKAGDVLIPWERIRRIDFEGIEHGVVVLHTDDGEYEAHGFDAIDALYAIRPSALEGRRLVWKKGAWRVHNWIGHPVMDLLAMLGLTRCAIAFHDYTTPKPRGFRTPRNS